MHCFRFGILFALSLFLFLSCSVSKKNGKGSNNAATNNESAKNLTEIIFGWGGGFTGMVDEFRLTKDGTLRQGKEIKKKIDSKQMKVVLKTFKKVNFSKVKINDPGNLYYFLAIKTGDNEQRLTWNDMTQLPAEVKEAYDALIALTKQ